MHGLRKWMATYMVGAVLLLGGCFNRPAATGTLVVDYPLNYAVQIDGQVRGTTNQLIPALAIGEHSVALVMNGQSIWSDQVVIIGGETLTVVPKPINNPTPAPHPEPPTEPSPIPQPTPQPTQPTDTSAYAASLVADFAERDAMPETLVPESRWDSYGKYGPPAAHYPVPTIPAGYNSLQWQRDRVVAVAKKYLGKVPYEHKHIPSLGLDCSNFTAWVYNYGLGIKFTSSVSNQAATVGRQLGTDEPLKPGDLLFFKDSTGRIIHAAIYIEPGYLIDESGNVAMKRFPYGWTETAFAHARRVLE